MNTLIQKKVNLLVHLAKIDGHLDESEKKLILEVLLSAGENPSVNWAQSVKYPLNNVFETAEPERLLYWALKLIKVDGILHNDEIAYCKALAVKLKYKPAIIDHFTKTDLPELVDFVKVSKDYQTS